MRASEFRSCPVCGDGFVHVLGEKTRKTCPKRACTIELMRRNKRNLKGDASSPQAARGRARTRIKRECCAECGVRKVGRGLVVHHIDHNPYNNEISNLQVLCGSCHRNHHPQLNQVNRLRGEASPRSKVTVAAVIEIRRRRAGGELNRTIGEDYGITPEAVSSIVLRKVWRHVQ